MDIRRLLLLIGSVFLGLAVEAAFASDPEPAFDVRAHYDKTEHRVRMRDGVELYTVVYAPKDGSQKYPILLQRTPYWSGPYGDAYRSAQDISPSEHFLRDGYIFAIQEWRGTYRSGGEFVDFRPLRKRGAPRRTIDESTDTYDTIEWLIANVPNNNGRVGQWGISHPAWATVMGTIDAHPALKASSPQATTGDPFIGDDYHHNGAFVLVNLDFLDWMTSITGPGRATLTAPPREMLDWSSLWTYDFYLRAGPTDQIDSKYYAGRLMPAWKNLMAHPDYDEYWQQRNFIAPLDRVRVPVLNVAGWFDQPDPYGTLATYQGIEKKVARNDSTLVIGPWRHGGWHLDRGERLADIEFGSATTSYYQDKLLFPFFQHYLKGKGEWRPREATVFETGGNRWHEFDRWPPRTTARALYLRGQGQLSFSAPQAGEGADSYISDPSRPVPYAPLGQEGNYSIADQRYAYSRPDVLTYQSEVLENDVTVAGPIRVDLQASTSGTDSDWFVKLIDVHPGNSPDSAQGVDMSGYQMLVVYEVMRGKYRNSLSKPEPMTPDRPTAIGFELRDRFHTFRKGHRIMVQIHSSWFPLFDRNPQTFTNIYSAKPEQYRRAQQRIYHDASAASYLTLPVFEGSEAR